MSAADVIVVGAGALGLAAAAALRARGREVVVLAPDGNSASRVAAGMLAPAFESVLEGLSAADAAILRRAGGLWDDFAEAHGVVVRRDGAEWRGSEPSAMAARLQTLGFATTDDAGRIVVPDEAWLRPDQALGALGQGLRRVAGRLARLEGRAGQWRLTTQAGAVLQARQVVLATGWARLDCGVELPPIQPIRGQAVVVSGHAPARVVRGDGIYVVPQAGGAILGATMEVGRSDLVPDPAVSELLMDRAGAICPELAGARIERVSVGVRGASPDGWPYAGALQPGLAVALAPRRNGWLLAPMVAGLVADALEDCDPGVVPSILHPGRFA